MLLSILLVIIVTLLVAPLYLSSDSFKRMLQAKVADSTGGELNIGNLSVGWLKGVKVSNLSFREQTGWASVNVEAIDTQPRLGALLGGNLALGRTVLDRPEVEIDLRRRPPVANPKPQSVPPPPTGLALLGDMRINNGSLSLTSRQGQTVRLASINSTVNLRSLGQTSSVAADMVVRDGGQEAQVRASATATPTGWTLKGTSGAMAVEVNDLDLGSLAPIFELAGLDLQAQGRLTADIEGTVQDGKIENINATVRGQNIDITGAPLQGDRLRTSQLNVNTKLAREGQTIRIEHLDAQTDWATVSASGMVPTSAQSLGELLQSGTNYQLQAEFDCNLAPLLSQMPNTLGLKPGMQITSGHATGTIDSTTDSGRATIVADAKIVDLAGQIDGKDLAITEPVTASLRLSADDQATRLDTLQVSAAFAQLTASGDFEQIKYEGTADLGALQAELGQFASLGPYTMAGNVTAGGQVSIADERISATGTTSARQLMLTLPDGNSVSEPSATVEYALALDQATDLLRIDSATARGSFGNVTVTDLSLPLGETPSEAMKADIAVRDLDLAKTKPYAVLFAAFPQNIGLSGVAQSQLTVTRQNGVYRLRTDDTQVRDFRLTSPGKEPFAQSQMSVSANVQIDPSQKSVNVESLLVESPQIKITKGEFRKTVQAGAEHVEGSLEGQADWQAVGQATSMFLPEGVALSGRRPISADFSSTYPAGAPNGLMANLNGTATTGFDGAVYMGLNVGPTDLKVRVVNGLMQIEPFTATVNEGLLNFAAQANFRQDTPLLQTPKPMMLAQGVQINREMTSRLLQYVNPLFANVTGVSGIANFECQKLAIPLASGMENKTEVVGTISANDIIVEASGLLSQILTAMGGQTSGDRLTLQPTTITLQNGVVRYDKMEIDIGENPVIFSGAIGLDERLDMTVTLPFTTAGRTVRIGQPQQGQVIAIPLKGTLSRPELNVERLLQDQLLRGLGELLGR